MLTSSKTSLLAYRMEQAKEALSMLASDLELNMGAFEANAFLSQIQTNLSELEKLAKNLDKLSSQLQLDAVPDSLEKMMSPVGKVAIDITYNEQELRCIFDFSQGSNNVNQTYVDYPDVPIKVHGPNANDALEFRASMRLYHSYTEEKLKKTLEVITQKRLRSIEFWKKGSYSRQ